MEVSQRTRHSPLPLETPPPPTAATTGGRKAAPRSPSRVKLVLVAAVAAVGIGWASMVALISSAHGGATETGDLLEAAADGTKPDGERRRASSTANETTIIGGPPAVAMKGGYDDAVRSGIGSGVGVDKDRNSSKSSSVGFYVVSLDGVEGSNPANAGRLDAFFSSWREACGDDAMHFQVCPGTVHPKRGYGITQSFVNCFGKAMAAGDSLAYFFEDDARLFNSSFCHPAFRERLQNDMPDDLYLLLLGGHKWRIPDQSADDNAEAWDRGFVKIQRSYGAFGFAVPRGNMEHLRRYFSKYIEKGGEELSPDTAWFRYAGMNRKTIYASNPLIVRHEMGYSNTWNMTRRKDVGHDPRPFTRVGKTKDPAPGKDLFLTSGGGEKAKTKGPGDLSGGHKKKPAVLVMKKDREPINKLPDSKAAAGKSRLQKLAGQKMQLRISRPT